MNFITFRMLIVKCFAFGWWKRNVVLMGNTPEPLSAEGRSQASWSHILHPALLPYELLDFISDLLTKFIFPSWLMWLSGLECCPINQKFAGSIYQSGDVPRLQVWSLVGACTRGNQWMFLSHIDISLPLPLSLPSPLSLKSISMSWGENFLKVHLSFQFYHCRASNNDR